MLIKEKAEAMKVVVMTAFKGISQPNGTWVQVSITVLKDGREFTLEKNLLNGTPSSRAKANSWRDAVAMFVIPPNVAKTIMIEVMAVALPVERVAL